MAGSFKYSKEVAGRVVVVLTGTKTQTVNVCAKGKKTSPYEAIYELQLAGGGLPEEEFPPVENLEDLRDILVGRGGFLRAGHVSPLLANLVNRIPAPAIDNLWMRNAKAAVEQAITNLVDEFTRHPYLHRVEQSLHTRLHQLLKDQPEFAGDATIGATGWQTQLVHKEWPETVAEVGHARGRFDLAILAPQQLKRATLEHFRQGRIDAPIVIEIGLNYGFEHLQQDHVKLLQSRVRLPYLVHLSRVRITDEQKTRDMILHPHAPIQTAYVHHAAKGTAFGVKHLADSEIRQLDRAPTASVKGKRVARTKGKAA